MQSDNGFQPLFRISSIAGVPAGEVVEPDSAEAAAGLLADAAAAGSAVIPVGGGTHLGIGNPPVRADVVLSTRKLNRVLVYEPADMTLSVEGGATLASVQSTLVEHGQGLPIEVANPEAATIGGILAAALYGPKRLGWGTLRDYLIGISVAYPDGTVGKAGGLVVKNVSGFDLMRMHHGALGTLGVIVSANFKVLPAPRSERTVLVEGADPDMLTTIRTTTMNWRGKAAAFQIDLRNGTASAAIRIDGRDRTTALLAAELSERIPMTSSQLDPEASRAFWSEYVSRFDAGNDPRRWWLRSRVLPSQSLGLLGSLRSLAEREDLEISVSPGLGFVDVLGSGPVDKSLSSIRAMSPRTSIVSMPAAARDGHEAWGSDIDGVELMRSLKREFDPGQVLNPGRFAGGL